MPNVVVSIHGMVADVSGSTLILNVGTSAGVNVGDTLKVSRAGREIKDPATGKVLRVVETEMGTVTIRSADSSSSEGTYAGAPGVKVGDRVKN